MAQEQKQPVKGKPEAFKRVYADIPVQVAKDLKIEAVNRGITTKELFAEILKNRKGVK